jgi:hypothetical protein
MPASIACRPWTFCRNCGMKYKLVNKPVIAMAISSSELTYGQSLNTRRSISGLSTSSSMTTYSARLRIPLTNSPRTP